MPSRRTGAIAALGAFLALAPALALRGFTVDDALISARYAANLAHGAGYRFNALGARTDGVTPLGWPILLAPFAGHGPLAALLAAKILGVVAWTIAAALLAVAIDGMEGKRARYAALAMLAASAPLGAWSVAGMETGLVIALAALAAGLGRLGHARASAAFAGISAAMRPELIPWAAVVAVAPPPRGSTAAARPPWDRLLRGALALGPPLAVALTRLAVFGRAAPLSILAKPSDEVLGARYALACFLLTGPLALIAPLAWRRLDGFARVLLIAIGVHFVAVAVAGGDWMPLSRLVAPVLPAVILVAAEIAAVADLRLTAARLALALAGEIFQIVKVGPAATHVTEDRLALIAELRGPLAGRKVIAALDIGWLGAATDATIVDLAGLTDPAIAVLPGGHTSKAIPASLLEARGVDTLVLQVQEGKPRRDPWTTSSFGRNVELRLARIPGMEEAFHVEAESAAPHLHYLVLARTPQ
ncbi:MAG: hypothetical protein ABJE95_15620 [Byssovorax sp.]